MVNTLNFKNESGSKIEVLIEPAAEYFDLDIGESILIEFEHMSKLVSDALSIVFQQEMLIIYEMRQCTMKIYKANDLVYYTSYL